MLLMFWCFERNLVELNLLDEFWRFVYAHYVTKNIWRIKQATTHSLYIGYLHIRRSVDSVIPGMHSMNLLILTSLIILFQRFSTPPTIFVTASHQVPRRPQDAMAVWVEDLRVDNFKICLREAKIFDGPHKGIKIVSKFEFCFLSVVILIS